MPSLVLLTSRKPRASGDDPPACTMFVVTDT